MGGVRGGPTIPRSGSLCTDRRGYPCDRVGDRGPGDRNRARFYCRRTWTVRPLPSSTGSWPSTPTTSVRSATLCLRRLTPGWPVCRADGLRELERNRRRLQPRRRESTCGVLGRRISAMGQSFLLRRSSPADPHALLRGTGSTVRSVRIEQSADLDERVNDLLDAAVVGWPWQFDSRRPTTTVIVSVSDRKRPRP